MLGLPGSQGLQFRGKLMDNVAVSKTWRPVGRVLRRVLGVLVEKAKTTPDVYPMTVNAIATAANQKSNRSPKMELTPEDVENALDELRSIGAVVEVQGDGRKFRYKHLLYEWLGVDKLQLAVMAELLLRGEQTLGDLRARAARMEKIDGQSELKPIVDNLIAMNLILPLSPEGRGQIVTHNLYLPEELAKLERQLKDRVNDEQDTLVRKPANETAAIAVTSSRSDLHQSIAELTKTVGELLERVERLEQKQ